MTTDTPGVVTAVVVFSLAAAGVCLILAAYFAFVDHRATAALREAAKQAGASAGNRLANPANPANPATAQTGPIDFKGLAELATALEKLNRSSSFLIAALAFAAAAAVAAGAGSIASAV
jgi:hypothetical protein